MFYYYSYATCAKRQLKKFTINVQRKTHRYWKKDEIEQDNAKDSKKAVPITKDYEELVKGQNKKIINIVDKQGELLKQVKELH